MNSPSSATIEGDEVTPLLGPKPGPETTTVRSDNAGGDIDERYLNSRPFAKFYRSVLCQMILLGCLSFVGPAISDAIGNLGGGGFSKPYLANLATALNYVGCCVMSLLGGPLINKMGIRWSCMIAAVTMPLYGSAYYAQARYSTSWYLILTSLVTGATGGFLYVGESTAMLSYPLLHDRGFYLVTYGFFLSGVWSAMRNSGSIVGGGINFSVNHSNSQAGAVSWSTYLIFVGFQCTGVIWAFFLSPSSQVRRRDGSKVPISGEISWKNEFIALWRHIRTRKMMLVFIPAFYSFFFGGAMSTYLTNHFSVRARALSSLLFPTITVVLVIFYGQFLDSKRWPQKSRAWIGFAIWAVLQAGGLIWIGIEYGKFGADTVALDYALDGKRWAEAYIPYLIVCCTAFLTQICLYWILGTFSTDIMANSRTGGLFRAFETAGQATCFALNSSSGIDPKTPFYVQCGLLLASVPCMILLIQLVPDNPAATDTVVGTGNEIVSTIGRPEEEHRDRICTTTCENHDQ
ncbi:membrane protein [Xylariomycetidae sp. FL2044]|nr:membrane protein [Xylariomycetidae sp. FL2044]